MSTLINIDGSEDPAYRYKMPRLISKVEGKGNGVKTVIVNCSDIGKALNRPPGQITKFFGCELGAISKNEEKIDKFVVNGSFETTVMQETLTIYIQKFVLCPLCGNPETIQEVKGKKKSALVMLSCKACGGYEMADNQHKLIGSILKEMKDDKNAGKSKKEERRKKRIEKNKEKENGEEEEDGEKKKKKKKKKKDGDDSEKKKRKSKKKKKTSAAGSEENKSDGEERGEDVDVGALTVHDLEALNLCVERVRDLVSSEPEENIVKQIEEQQTNAGLSRGERIPIAVYALCSPEVSLNSFIEKCGVIKSVTEGVKDLYNFAKDLEIDILLSMEEAVARCEEDKKADMTKRVPIVLKEFYENDILEEGTIIAWSEQKLEEEKFKHVIQVVEEEEAGNMRAAAAPIIEWLQQSESEDSDDE